MCVFWRFCEESARIAERRERENQYHKSLEFFFFFIKKKKKKSDERDDKEKK